MSTTTCVSIAAAILLSAQDGSFTVSIQTGALQWPQVQSEPVTAGQSNSSKPDAANGRPAALQPAPNGHFVRKSRDVDGTGPEAVEPVPVRLEPVAGDTIVDLGAGVRIELAFIPAGDFRMGSDDGQADEFPVRRVVIPRGFLIGKFEVTQAQWKAVMGSNPSAFTGDETLPVERVSWEDCREFIRRLNEQTGGGWRLPTESEWEYACRAGINAEFGGDVETVGWSRANSGLRPHPVGEKSPNRWGLYDTHGNVWEWCDDWYDPSSYGRTNGTERVGPKSGVFRVSRGGSWYDDASLSRSANRNGTKPTARSVTLGLRLVRDVR